MGKLIYSMLTSLDGYTEDEHGRFGWGAPEDVGGRRTPRDEPLRAKVCHHGLLPAGIT
jgi:hypothetical protein